MTTKKVSKKQNKDLVIIRVLTVIGTLGFIWSLLIALFFSVISEIFPISVTPGIQETFNQFVQSLLSLVIFYSFIIILSIISFISMKRNPKISLVLLFILTLVTFGSRLNISTICFGIALILLFKYYNDYEITRIR